jgi:hypothetical protein
MYYISGESLIHILELLEEIEWKINLQ